MRQHFHTPIASIAGLRRPAVTFSPGASAGTPAEPARVNDHDASARRTVGLARTPVSVVAACCACAVEGVRGIKKTVGAARMALVAACCACACCATSKKPEPPPPGAGPCERAAYAYEAATEAIAVAHRSGADSVQMSRLNAEREEVEERRDKVCGVTRVAG